VVITPEPGQNPVISRIRISSGATLAARYWKLDGLTVQSEATGGNATASYTLLEIYPDATDITVSNCTITSNPNTAGWTRDDWRNRCNNGLSTRGRLHANYIIENNLILNTAFALSISSSHTIVRGNRVRNFTNDGCRVLGSDILFERNSVMDLIKVMTTQENHDDLFQSFTYPAGGAGQDTLKNNIIRRNIFVNTSDTTRPFRGNAQGIGCFDGVYLNWIIENNIVLTDHWHGISMYGAVNCMVRNNTVLDPYRISPVDPYDSNRTDIGPAWILISKKTPGPASSGNLVTNNLVAGPVTFSDPSMGSGSHNISIGVIAKYALFFADVSDLAHPDRFDLHLRAGCAAIDAGEGSSAASTDYDGSRRPQGAAVDVGAFEYPDSIGAGVATEAARLLNLLMYPNPSDGIVHVAVGGLSGVKRAGLSVVTVTGKMVYTALLNGDAGRADISLPVALAKGVYFVHVAEGERSCFGSLVIR
jgi:parallel beta-helix repeat protein